MNSTEHRPKSLVKSPSPKLHPDGNGSPSPPPSRTRAVLLQRKDRSISDSMVLGAELYTKERDPPPSTTSVPSPRGATRIMNMLGSLSPRIRSRSSSLSNVDSIDLMLDGNNSPASSPRSLITTSSSSGSVGSNPSSRPGSPLGNFDSASDDPISLYLLPTPPSKNISLVRVFFVPYSTTCSSISSDGGRDLKWATYWTLMVTLTTTVCDLLNSVSFRINIEPGNLYICSCDEITLQQSEALKDKVIIMELNSKRFFAYELVPDGPIEVSSPSLTPSSSSEKSPPTSPSLFQKSPSSPSLSGQSSPNNAADIYCKFLLVPSAQEDQKRKEEDRLSLSSSSTDVDRVRMVDTYFQHYYKELFYYLMQRAKRREAHETAVKMAGLSDEKEAKALLLFNAKETKYLRMKRTRMNVKEFKMLARIGKGGFGEVYLAIKKDTNEIVTLKRIKRAAYHEMANQTISVANEQQVMMVTQDFEWITKLLYSFQDSQFLYLAMEYHCGGDFRMLLTNLGGLSEDVARFYIAEMIEAVHSLHKIGFVHRDIKPSNFVIDKTGHIKLIDFGLSKTGVSERNSRYNQTWRTLRQSFSMGTTNFGASLTTGKGFDLNASVSRKSKTVTMSRVGSPEYMAPEVVIDNQDYDIFYDIWGLGVVLLEMLMGDHPFSATTVNGVFLRIMNWKNILDWDEIARVHEISDTGIDLLKHILCEHDDRWNIDQIRTHPFFAGIKWSALHEREPPFVPKVESELDTSYFEDAVTVIYDANIASEDHDESQLTTSGSSSSAVSSSSPSPSCTPSQTPLLPPQSPPRYNLKTSTEQHGGSFGGFAFRRFPSFVAPGKGVAVLKQFNFDFSEDQVNV